MMYRSANNIGICFSALIGLCLFILLELLPGFANGADVPQTVTTGSIVFTGMRFEPKNVNTGPIVFTGMRFEPKNVNTGPIVFTGLRFEPKSVKTGSILFTGMGQETTLGLFGSKALIGQKEADVSKAGRFRAKAVKPSGKTKAMPKETPTGFIPSSREKIKKNAGKLKKVGEFVPQGKQQAVPGSASVVQKKVIKKALVLELPELEIKVNSKPVQVCPDKNYNVNITIINHSDLKARFNLCSVGSHTYKCDLGQPPVHEINGKATRSLSMSIRPAAPFVKDEKWHGKVFLGKVKSQSNEIEMLQVGGNQPNEPSDCNVGVSTSWSGGVGFFAGTLFCDNNMDNNIVKLEINSSPALCNPKLMKKMDTKIGTKPGKKKTIIKPTIEDKRPKVKIEKSISKPGIQLK